MKACSPCVSVRLVSPAKGSHLSQVVVMSSNHPEPTIRRYTSADWQAVRDICVIAFTPIHEGFERALGRELFLLVYPDWRASNESYLRSLCETNESQRILLA